MDVFHVGRLVRLLKGHEVRRREQQAEQTNMKLTACQSSKAMQGLDSNLDSYRQHCHIVSR